MFARGTPTEISYGDLFADWELDIARKLAWKAYARSAALKRWREPEDLVEEVLIHWHRVRGRYEAKKGANQRTFMAKVVRNRLLELARAEKTDRRRLNSLAARMSTPIGKDLEGPTLADEVDETNLRPYQTGQLELYELHRLLQDTISRLGSQDRRIVELLGMDVAKRAIAKELGIHPTKLYAGLERIRKLFHDRGLKDFLK